MKSVLTALLAVSLVCSVGCATKVITTKSVPVSAMCKPGEHPSITSGDKYECLADEDEQPCQLDQNMYFNSKACYRTNLKGM